MMLLKSLGLHIFGIKNTVIGNLSILFGKRMVRVLLADVKHETMGKHSPYCPLSIGFIASYTKKVLGDLVDIRLYSDVETILNEYKRWKPDVVGLTNYSWSSNLSYFLIKEAKKNGALTVMGGPDFNRSSELRHIFLSKRDKLDFYVYSDGEIAFSRLVSEYIKNNELNLLKKQKIDGVVYINYDSELVTGNIPNRFKNLDDIPSPYLNGFMDKFLEQGFSPALQVSRGCPFKCTFCNEGSGKYIKRIGQFSKDRVIKELDYIVTRTKSGSLGIHDSNWNLFKSDFEISSYIGKLVDERDWPKYFEATTTRKNRDRTAWFYELIKGRTGISLSLQTMNEETAKIIKRKDGITEDSYLKEVEYARSKGALLEAELIIPMPKETKETYFYALNFLMKHDVRAITFTLMMLRGTDFENHEMRALYGMETKFRLVPRSFSQFDGEKVFEIEEVCIATNTLPYDDYLDCRGMGYVMEILTSYEFAIIRKLLKFFKIDSFDFALEVKNELKEGGSLFSEIYNNFISETEYELFDSEEDIVRYYSEEDNYSQLLSGSKGDNLIRKYLVKFFMNKSDDVFEFIKKIFYRFNIIDKNILEEAIFWAIKVITPNIIFFEENDIDKEYIETFNYNYDSWLISDEVDLDKFKGKMKYSIQYDVKYALDLREETLRNYGFDMEFGMGRNFMTYSHKSFWRKCRRIQEG